MFSASEEELGALFITAQKMVAMRQTVEEMKCPPPKSPIQTDNSAAAGVVKIPLCPENSRQWTDASTGSDAEKLRVNLVITGQAEIRTGLIVALNITPPSITNRNECNYP